MAVHWDSVVWRFGLAVLICVPALLSGGCGGGGNGGGTSGANTPPPTSTPPPAPLPVPNRPPVLAIPNGTKVAVHRHPFSYDVGQGGTSFSDPDGDALRYEIKIGHVWNPYADPNPPAGLRVEGTMIIGAPEELEAAYVTVTAVDSQGQTASDQFTIRVVPNTPPTAINPQQDHVLAVGAPLDLDATKRHVILGRRWRRTHVRSEPAR